MTSPAAVPSPFRLLLRVHALSAWRRLLSLRQKSRLMLALVAFFLVGYAALAYVLFYQGLRFISRFPGLGGLLVERLLFLLFACLFGLLLLSNLVIGYANLFRNRETTFLLPLPIPPGVVFRWKFVESVLLASWAFLFLVAPLLVAYGIIHRVPWHFYPATAVLVLLFVVLPGVAGSAIAIVTARRLDRRGFRAVLLLALGALLAWIALRLRPAAVSDEMLLETRVLVVIDRLLDNTRLVQFPMLPSYWIGAAVQHHVEGALPTAGFYGLVLLSYTLFFGLAAATRLGGPFREAAALAHGLAASPARRGWFRARGPGLLEALVRRVPGIPGDVAAMIVKDARLFWRDTTQWGQGLMLFGLLAVYLLNLRHFTRRMDSAFWVSLTSFLNLGACSLNLATVTTRFVFPQFSLEGRRVWIVGLAPLGLVRLVWWKFVAATAATLLLTLGLTLLSCRMLRLDAPRTAYFAMAVAVMTAVLNALAVGLGAVYPDFRETNPARIVSGFGGTLCLVLSFVYIVGSVALLAVGSPWGWRGDEEASGRAAFTWTVFVLVSLLAAWLPLRLGMRRAGTMEL